MRAALVALLLAFSPALLLADHSSDLYVIPVAGHVSGFNGTSWASDVAIHNYQPVPLTVEIVVIESGEGRADNVTALLTAAGSSVTIEPGGTRILRDVLAGHRGLSQASGALLLGASRPFAVSSRFFSMTSSGTSHGLSVVPVADFLENSLGDTNLADASAYLPGLTANSKFRTNLGFVAGTSAPGGMTVEVTLRGRTGETLGSKSFKVPGSGFTHVQFSSLEVANRNFDEGSAMFRITAGDGAVVPYAAVIDNMTSAAFYVTAQFPDNSVMASASRQRSVFRDLLERAVR